MPIYDYRCKVCHYEQEFLHGLNQAVDKHCPKGCGETLEQLVSAPSVRFAGGGYYETDEKPKSKQRNVIRKEESSKTTASSEKSTS